ncbi:MAG: alpha/beta hydrolase family protein [Betaproteobacteria bacterium]|nr:alpha/beta hydrolase family protein [Betaproteobacteria bacterium]
MIIYLHGFRSSPQSYKAQLLAERMAQLGRASDYLCPQLPVSPAEAIGLAQNLTRDRDPAQLTLFGSSLGGYYATYLAEQLGCRAVMLNPAMRAFEKLKHYVGPQTMYHGGGEAFDFKAEYLEELRAMFIPAITRPERYFLVAATGDELLDWREMAANFPGARHKVIGGSDHGLSDFADYMDETLAFAGVTSPAG